MNSGLTTSSYCQNVVSSLGLCWLPVDKESDMSTPPVHPPCPRPTRQFSTLHTMIDWYRRWVRVREARYRYLAAILDGAPVSVAERCAMNGDCDSSGDRSCCGGR